MDLLIGKLETEVELKVGANEFYNLFKSQAHLIPNISSDNIRTIEVHQGDWETLGSVKKWDYNVDGKAESVKEVLEAVDDEKKLMKFNVVDGELLKHYKIFRATLQVYERDADAGSSSSLVKWTFDYEKLTAEIPHPEAYKELAEKMTKDIEAHLLKA